MNEKNRLMSRLHRGQFVLMDGALGTELEKRGVPFEGAGWSAVAVRDHGDVIRQTHQDFIIAGAEMHIVNSFALARHVLEPIGMGGDFVRLNWRAVTIFDEAVKASGVERSALSVAGSLSTFAAHSDRSLLPRGKALEANYRDQAQILFDAGVDLFALEMLFDEEVSVSMLNAVAAFGLPVIVGITCDWQDDNDEVVSAKGMGCPNRPLEELLPVIMEAAGSVDAILAIMHSEFDVTDAAIDIVKKHWQGPLAIYPNSGEFVDLRMQFDSVCDVDSFQQAAQRWIDMGVNIVGGCCGIGPAHIAALADRVK